MKVTASIVTYNSADEILTVLQSLSKVELDDFQIVVVDNSSIDNTVELVKKNYPTVNIISLKENIGFGSGQNIAIKQIESDFHIIINPDINVESDEIVKMLAYLEANKEVVLLTPKVLNNDGTEQFLPKVFPKIKYVISGKLEKKQKYSISGEVNIH